MYARNDNSPSKTSMVGSEVAAQIIQLQNILENGDMLIGEEMPLILKSAKFQHQLKLLTTKGIPTKQ